MTTAEILISLMLAVCGLAMLAQRLRVAPPVVFLLGGVVFAGMPGLRDFTIEPSQILTIFLPPLLMEAAYFTSLRDLQRSMIPILQLAVGLVFVTAAAVAYVFMHLVPDAGWAAAFVLGAIVSPPDAVAAVSVTRGMRVPKRILTILEGESLINDAAGLVLYKFAVAAVITSQFSFSDAGLQLLWMCFAGISIGLGVGKLFVMCFPRMRDSSIEILCTFIVPYGAYLLAESLHSSGVLAVVASGLYVNWHAPRLFSAQLRMPAEAVWKMTTFFLSALVFLMIGIQIPLLFHRLVIYSPLTLTAYAGAVCATAFLVRLVYVFSMAYGTRMLFSSLRKRDPLPSWQNVFLVAFTGMRGVVSLATALALPVTISWGVDFPYRDLIIFLAVALIVFTLVVQGLLLPFIVDKLKLTFDHKLLHEAWHARYTAASTAIQKIAELEQSGATENSAALSRIKSHYQTRLEALGDGPNTPLSPHEEAEIKHHPVIQEEHRILQEVLSAERQAVIDLRGAYTIGDDIMNDLLRELDLLSSRFAH